MQHESEDAHQPELQVRSLAARLEGDRDAFDFENTAIGMFLHDPVKNNVMPFQCNFSYLVYFVSVILALFVL